MSRRMLEVQIRQVNAQTFVHNYPWHGLFTDTLHLRISFPSSVDISLKGKKRQRFRGVHLIELI